MECIVTVQSQSCGALTFSSMIPPYFAGEYKISLFKILDSDLLFTSSVFQLSSDVNCHHILQQIIWNHLTATRRVSCKI